MKKRMVSLLLSAALLLSVGALPAAGATFGDFQYTSHWDTEADYRYAVVTGYTGSETVVTVPAEMDGLPVRHIRSLAGGKCPERLVIPSSVRVVEGLFADMSALREIEMPGSTAILYPAALEGCSSLTISVPQGDIVLAEDESDFPTFLPVMVNVPEGVTIRVEKGTGLAKRYQWGTTREENPYAYCELFSYDYAIGDLNADGKCTTTDARMGLQYAAGRATLTDEQIAVADVDGNGTVNTTDARLMLQYAAGRAKVEAIAVPRGHDGVPFVDAATVTQARLEKGSRMLLEDPVVTCDTTTTDPATIAEWVASFNAMMQGAALEQDADVFNVKLAVDKSYGYFVLTLETTEGTVQYRNAWGKTALCFDETWYLIGTAYTHAWDDWSAWCASV